MIRIGLTCSLLELQGKAGRGRYQNRLNQAYVDAVLRAGAAPLPLPFGREAKAMDSLLDACSGLILTGGGDIHPRYYGEGSGKDLGNVSEDRDRFEFCLFEKALGRGIPVFGICRGLQLINVAWGGTLYQDLEDQPAFERQHRQEADRRETAHKVYMEEGSLLYQVLGAEAQVNSLHHQAIKDLAPRLKATAWSADGLIEGVESLAAEETVVFAVQWHPEELSEKAAGMAALFSLFVSLCEKGAG